MINTWMATVGILTALVGEFNLITIDLGVAVLACFLLSTSLKHFTRSLFTRSAAESEMCV